MTGGVIYVQSNQKDPEFIISRIENFIQTVMNPFFTKLSNDDFVTAAKGL